MHGIGEHERLLYDPAAVADLLDLCVEPQVRVAALERSVAKGLHLLVEALADPGSSLFEIRKPR